MGISKILGIYAFIDIKADLGVIMGDEISYPLHPDGSDVHEIHPKYLVRDNDDGPPQVFDRKAINRYYYESHDEWELYGRIDYSCPGRARLCVLNTHNNPYQRSAKIPYI